MADLADLQGTVLGMKKSEPLQPGYDVDQPWYVRFRTKNAGKGPVTTPFSVRLETMINSDVDSGVFCFVSQRYNFDTANPMTSGFIIESDFHLPTAIKQTEFGSTHAFLFTIDSKNEVEEVDKNNNLVASNGLPAIISAGASPSPPASKIPSPAWHINTVKGISGDKRSVSALITNNPDKETPPGTLDLYFHSPKSTSGKPERVGSATIPALARRAEKWVTVAAKEDFIEPAEAAPMKSGAPPKETASSRFKVLIPFSLEIRESGREVGFGPPLGRRAAPIRIRGNR
jgi:hypothetical protein